MKFKNCEMEFEVAIIELMYRSSYLLHS